MRSSSMGGVVSFTRMGKTPQSSVATITECVRRLPSSAIIDGEIIVADSEGKPDFKGLMEGHTGMLVVWCFDLLAISGRDVRAKSLLERRTLLRKFLGKAREERVRYSEEFSIRLRF